MTKTEQENFRQQLLELGARLKGHVSGLSDEALRKTGGEASGSLSNMPLHMADLGTDNFEQEVTMSLLESEEQTLEEIATALRRVEQGTFGKCEECHQEIARERLKAIPYARHCIMCAQKLQGENPTGRV